jgi:hypothetical protein
MTEPTKAGRVEAGKKAAATRAKNEADRSAAAKKAAATRAENEAKAGRNDLRKAAGSAGKGAVDLGKVVVGTTGKTAKALGKQAARLIP